MLVAGEAFVTRVYADLHGWSDLESQCFSPFRILPEMPLHLTLQLDSGNIEAGLVHSGAFVPAYRCGAVPDFQGIPFSPGRREAVHLKRKQPYT